METTKHVIPQWAINCQVTDVASVAEFADKYRKHERFRSLGEEYVNAVMESHHKEIQETGFTAISRYESVIGKYLTFIPNSHGKTA